MLPDVLHDRLSEQLGTEIKHYTSVGGGCIANASRLETEDGRFFLKWGPAEVACTFPGEARGLRALGEAGSPLFIPDVVAVDPAAEAEPGYLCLEWIPSGRKRGNFWEDFGRGMAALHRYAEDRYGFTEDNYIGRLPQRNVWEEEWPEFFRKHRLAPQVARARRGGDWRADWDAPLEKLYRVLPELLPAQPPASILHGDLWGGNFMVTATGEAALIDPAAYYGHREADLAMTELFGGFEADFYAAYREAWPLESGYELRRQVYNLYHLINHLNHFGASYVGQVGRVLDQFA